jgi:hypothetical protein
MRLGGKSQKCGIEISSERRGVFDIHGDMDNENRMTFHLAFSEVVTCEGSSADYPNSRA